MITFMKRINNQLIKTNETDLNGKMWINLVNPTTKEIDFLIENLKIDKEFLIAALDLEERSRIDYYEEQNLIIFNANFKTNDEYEVYETIPVGIILKDDIIVTVCKENLYLENIKNKIKNYEDEWFFIVNLLYNLSLGYLSNLRNIDRKTTKIETLLYKDTKKKYIIELLNLEKSLVYFNAALTGNEIVINKIYKTVIKDDEFKYLIEDVLIEIQQANQMAKINSRIINSIREAFQSIDNNSINLVMKSLASITIIINIPMLITSFLGMNIYFPDFISKSVLFVYVLSILMLLLTYFIYKKMKKKGLL